MKKYTAFVIFVLIACLFSSSPQSVNADVVVGGPGCTPGAFYSVTTGKPCRSWSSCNPGDLYDWVTGKECSNATKPIPRPAIDILEAECSEPMVLWSRGQKIRAFQEELKNEGFLPASSKVDGIYGPVTQAASVRYREVQGCDKPNYFINILSPAGKETWVKNTIQVIKWQSNKYIDCGDSCSSDTYDIYLEASALICGGTSASCGNYSEKIAQGVDGSSYSWKVGTLQSTKDRVRTGGYKIKVCYSGTDTCGWSDNFFRIVDKAEVEEIVL